MHANLDMCWCVVNVMNAVIYNKMMETVNANHATQHVMGPWQQTECTKCYNAADYVDAAYIPFRD